MSRTIKIGTHNSKLALWKANAVQQMLEKLGYSIEIKSTENISDIDSLLLNNTVDIAVHTLTDVPTTLTNGIAQVAVIKRGNFKDVLVFKNNEEFLSQRDAIIATESPICRAQWLNRYPTHTIVSLSGDLSTQLQQFEDNDTWNAAIFSAAALGKLGLKPKNTINLDWMIPTPAQGAIAITALEENEGIREICAELNHEETQICTHIEREFFKLLDGNTTTPIGALTFIKEEEVSFKGILLSPDGSKKIEISRVEHLHKHNTIAPFCADYIIDRSGKSLIDINAQNSKPTNIYSTKSLTKDQNLLFNEYVVAKSSDFVKISLNRIKPQVIRNPIDNVIIANKHSVEALLNNFSAVELQFKKIYCVGRRTKRLIEKRIGPVKHVEKNEKALAEYLVEYIDGTEATYFSGDAQDDELTSILNNNHININQVEAYQTKYDAETVEDSVEGVLFYSPSTVQSYLKENHPDKIAFCINETTATEAKKKFEDVRVTKVPTTENLIQLVNQHYDTI